MIKCKKLLSSVSFYYVMQLVRIERKLVALAGAVEVDGVKLGIGSDGETSVESDAENG